MSVDGKQRSLTRERLYGLPHNGLDPAEHGGHVGHYDVLVGRIVHQSGQIAPVGVHHGTALRRDERVQVKLEPGWTFRGNGTQLELTTFKI